MPTKNPLDRLASLGEEVIGKAAQNPTASRLLQSAMQMRERVDDLSKRVRGLEGMEKRLNQLEKRLAKLEGSRKTPARKTKTSSAKKTGTSKS
jgi:TolA-binding protein